MIAQAVHTTGVNWDGVLANAVAILVILSIVGTVIVRSLKSSIGDQVETIIRTDVTPVLNEIKSELHNHNTRIARLEGVEEGRKQAVAAAAVTTTKG